MSQFLMKHSFLTGLLLLALWPLGLQASQQLDSLKAISASGAPMLALKMLDQAQPDVQKQPYEWILWEQERYRVLEKWGLWQDLLLRLEQLPEGLPEPFLIQSETLQARAYLKQKEPQRARAVLRKLLWNSSFHSLPEYPLWRRLVLQSYLIQQSYRDARTTMLRYQQDFEDQDSEWQSLRARVLLLSEDFDEVLIQRQPEDGLAYIQYLYAEYRAGKKSAKSLWQQARTQLKTETDPALLTAWWMLVWQTAQEMSPVDRVIALENALKQEHWPEDPFWQPDVAQLWQAYRENAFAVSNDNQLLVGDHEAWQRFAQRATLLTPLKARTLLAHISQQGSEEQAERAAEWILKTLDLEQTENRRLLQRLYSPDQEIRIPHLLRHQLVDFALQEGDIKTATVLMQNLQAPDQDDLFDWHLRRARVLVLGGEYLQGSQVLEALLAASQQLDEDRVNRLLQVLFDLQTVAADELAIPHFQDLLSSTISPRQRREILFWLADSLKALQQYERAALMYLQSAMLSGPESMDPWAQTARFNAAESLQSAGLVDDARRIYLALLKVTKDPARRSLLRHNIQQLWLRQ